ncbi:hypothetical protein INQ41_06195 [Lysobacter ciconiae]|uniref:D-sorbitol dehydrogenase-like protein n=1 Tax=Novilysobacter ciconiae TaxID=2781022 RepID=A0A7S6UHZ8_9GAMM|nr:sugar dehydrogenase complex small subunit [Lysobacter ciconiae]QOW20589.1 hypothetical protein INQ41_06195 [Lysobacter ciconiae]
MSDDRSSPASSVNRSTDLGRRRFLAVSALAASVAVAVGASPGLAQGVVAATEVDPDFVELSRFLTARPELDARIVARAHQGLTQAHTGFAAQWAALDRAISGAKLADVDAFAASDLYGDPALRGTAMAIISAFYLGQVGQGDDATLVSFEKALMFQPTEGIIVIPTYALGGPNYWDDLVLPAE